MPANLKITKIIFLLLLYLVIGIFFLNTAPIFAQSIIPPKLSLESAVEKALENNPQTKITEKGIKIAELKIDEAKLSKKPFVQFSSTVTGGNNPVFVFGSRLEQGRFGASNFAIDSLNHPQPIVNFRSVVSVHKSLFDQKQTVSRITQAQIGKSQAELQAEFVRQQLRFNILRSYYGTVLAKELLKVSDGAINSAKENSKKAKDLVEVGMVTDADYLAAEVEVANAHQQKLEAESNLFTTNAALNILLDEKPELEREFTDDLTEKYFPIEDRDELIRIALENRPEYQKADLEIQTNREQKKSILNKQKLPEVNAFGNFGYSSPYLANGSTDFTVGVSLTYTLFDAGKKNRLEQATEGESLAQLEKEDLANQIRLDVIRAEQNFKTSRAKILVSVKSITQAEEALRIIYDRYKFGLMTFNELVRAENALVRAKSNLLMARYEYYIAYASVLLATGRLKDVRVFK
ncbi:MAG TPA: TolC family protein [Pyrinomonadaceae bacterium]|nr:TolC family protein [Pyrinomonadaceae bacterium]